jgi:hypothetical protein
MSEVNYDRTAIVLAWRETIGLVLASVLTSIPAFIQAGDVATAATTSSTSSRWELSPVPTPIGTWRKMDA